MKPHIGHLPILECLIKVRGNLVNADMSNGIVSPSASIRPQEGVLEAPQKRKWKVMVKMSTPGLNMQPSTLKIPSPPPVNFISDC